MSDIKKIWSLCELVSIPESKFNKIDNYLIRQNDFDYDTIINLKEADRIHYCKKNLGIDKCNTHKALVINCLCEKCKYKRNENVKYN